MVYIVSTHTVKVTFQSSVNIEKSQKISFKVGNAVIICLQQMRELIKKKSWDFLRMQNSVETQYELLSGLKEFINK